MINYLIIIVIGVVGATLTFYVSNELKQGRVRASALLSLLVSLVFYFFPDIVNEFLTNHIPFVFIGTSFIGMAKPSAKGNYLRLAFAGGLFSIIYLNKSQFFDGYGGALGALAFIALLASMTISDLLSKSDKISNKTSDVKKMFSKSQSRN